MHTDHLRSSSAHSEQRGQAALGISTTDAKLKSANQILRTVHQVLTYEKVYWFGFALCASCSSAFQERKRDQLGSCLFGTNEVFAPLQALKAELTGLHGKLSVASPSTSRAGAIG